MVTEFGRIVLKMLDDKEMSCYELGYTSLLGEGTISKLVNGKRPPNERHALRILLPLFLEEKEIETANELLMLADAYPFMKPRRKRG